MTGITFGRRIKANGENGDVVWCELSDEEVADVLWENVKLNTQVFGACVQQAKRLLGIQRPEDEASLAMSPALQMQVNETARALFEVCGLKGFAALQAVLEARVHEAKVAAVA